MDVHKCIVFGSPFRRLELLQKHIALPTKNGKARCEGLKRAIPTDLWNGAILPHYTKDAPLPNIEGFMKKKTSKK